LPRLRMCRALPPLPLIRSWCAQDDFNFTQFVQPCRYCRYCLLVLLLLAVTVA
jgi:hypothetical protein